MVKSLSLLQIQHENVVTFVYMYCQVSWLVLILLKADTIHDKLYSNSSTASFTTAYVHVDVGSTLCYICSYIYVHYNLVLRPVPLSGFCSAKQNLD